MDLKECASSWLWENIDWPKAEAELARLQQRIIRAFEEERFNRVRAVMRILVNSWSCRALAVRKTVTSKGRKTPGVDGVVWRIPDERIQAIRLLKPKGYQPSALLRVFRQKSNGGMRPLGIPIMKDRAMQTLYRFALEPIEKITGDLHSYGYRSGQRPQQAIYSVLEVLNEENGPEWVLLADIEGCFDNIDHDWLIEHIPMDKGLLRKLLKCGYVENGVLFTTDKGMPQGGPLSPVLCNMTLNGLEPMLQARYPEGSGVHFVRYADDFIVTGTTRELLEDVLVLLNGFLSERGLALSTEKTLILRIADGFDYLGVTIYWDGEQYAARPSQERIDAIIAKLRTTIAKMSGASPLKLINTLNPIVLGWANANRYYEASVAFRQIDNEIDRAIWNWMKARCPGEDTSQIKSHYFRYVNGRYAFAALGRRKHKRKKSLCWRTLVRMADTALCTN